MKNVTISMDEELARWARIHAARHGKSVSRMIGELVAERMRGEEGYESAMRQFLSRERGRLREEGPYPDREELHDRGAESWGRSR